MLGTILQALASAGRKLINCSVDPPRHVNKTKPSLFVHMWSSPPKHNGFSVKVTYTTSQLEIVVRGSRGCHTHW